MIFTFVLIEPAVPGNIGASARALKTMGFRDLILINPCNYLDGEARWLAHGSADVLENIKTFSDFSSSIGGFDLVIGTTANTNRSAKADYIPINQLRDFIQSKKQNLNRVAIVFGREESGLTNEELRQCDVVTTVPLKTTFPSLNLSQAVMLYAYELSMLTAEETGEAIADQNSIKTLKEKVRQLLIQICMDEESNIFRRIMERTSFLGGDDVNLVHSILAKLMNRLVD